MKLIATFSPDSPTSGNLTIDLPDDLSNIISAPRLATIVASAIDKYTGGVVQVVHWRNGGDPAPTREQLISQIQCAEKRGDAILVLVGAIKGFLERISCDDIHRLRLGDAFERAQSGLKLARQTGIIQCNHPKEHTRLVTDTETPVDGNCIEVCALCGRSRRHWEQGESDWMLVEKFQSLPVQPPTDDHSPEDHEL